MMYDMIYDFWFLMYDTWYMKWCDMKWYDTISSIESSVWTKADEHRGSANHGLDLCVPASPAFWQTVLWFGFPNLPLSGVRLPWPRRRKSSACPSTETHCCQSYDLPIWILWLNFPRASFVWWAACISLQKNSSHLDLGMQRWLGRNGHLRHQRQKLLPQGEMPEVQCPSPKRRLGKKKN